MSIIETRHTATRHTPRATHYALLAIGLGLTGLAMAATTSSLQFTQSLEAALADRPGVDDRSTLASITTAAGTVKPPVAGSESFWLDGTQSAAPIRPAAWTGRRLTPGDRLQISGGSEQRLLEVTDVSELPAATIAGSADASSHPVRTLLMVTLRDIQMHDAAPLRLLVNADAPLAGMTPLARTVPNNL